MVKIALVCFNFFILYAKFLLIFMKHVNNSEADYTHASNVYY